jgi:hypothetical protein
VLGYGIRFLASIRNRLEDPEVTVAAGVTHLRYRVKRQRETLRSGGVRIVGDRIVGQVGVLARV